MFYPIPGNDTFTVSKSNEVYLIVWNDGLKNKKSFRKFNK